MIKIRLMRIGTKKRPFYRVVAVDERKKRTGSYLENLGTYNPLTEPKEIKLNQERIDAWVKQGAQLSYGFLRILGKAPQKPARLPKKAAAEKPAPTAQPTPAETSAEDLSEKKEEEASVETPTETSEQPIQPEEALPTENVVETKSIEEEKVE